MKVDDVNNNTNVNSTTKDINDVMAILQQQATQADDNSSTVNSFESAKVIKADVDDNANYWPIDNIPTKYKLYPEGTMITARTLKVLEVKKLSSINESNADYVINDILKRTIKGIDIHDLYLADKLYIIFWLRANTYRDSSYRVEFVCPKCQKESSYHFAINTLSVNFLRDDYDPHKKITLENGQHVELSFLTIRDELEMERFIEINSPVIPDIDREMLGLALMLNINGTLMDKYNFVVNIMTPSDFSYLNSYIKKYGIGIEPYLNVECKECGGTAPIGVTFRGDFFLPICDVG